MRPRLQLANKFRPLTPSIQQRMLFDMPPLNISSPVSSSGRRALPTSSSVRNKCDVLCDHAGI